MPSGSVDLQVAFEILFSPEQLLAEFHRRHADAACRGLDRVSGSQYSTRIASEVGAMSRKCISGDFRFSPYLENLKVKGRKSLPRMISIPTVRDRIVLGQLNKLLRLAFPLESYSPLANNYVKHLFRELDGIDLAQTWVAGADIKRFYDSIDRERLFKIMRKRLGGSAAYSLVRRAVITPTVPRDYKRKDRSSYSLEEGVPQGLAISNALAAIYLHEVDTAMRAMPVKYFRFVDDVLIIGDRAATLKAQRSFAARVRARSLAVHTSGSKKGQHQEITKRFSYLGYVFSLPQVTVRESTVERLIHSLAAKIADYRYNRDRVLQKRPYLTQETLRKIFLEELNERISGAISGAKRYGWVAYFSEINDLSVLHRIDVTLRKILSKVPELSEHVAGLKKFSRAHFEMRHRPYGGYVRDYDAISTPVQMLRFLEFRGQVGPSAQLTEAQIVARFEAYRDQLLSAMVADEAVIY